MPVFCVPARIGLAVLHEPDAMTAFWPHQGCELAATADEVLSQPRLPIDITAIVGAMSMASVPGCEFRAATHYGPLVQDKCANEDFALALCTHDSDGAPVVCAAVSDGVSSSTMFPERAARLGVLAALAEVSAWFATRSVKPGVIELDQLAQAISERVAAAYLRDRQQLTESGQTPLEGHEPSTDEERADPTQWHNATLLVAALGPNFGVVFWSGDGHVAVGVRRGGERVWRYLLNELDSAPLRHWMSPDPSTHRICRRILSYGPGLDAIEIVMASDGAATAVVNGEFAHEALTGAVDLYGLLECASRLDGAPADNYSVAILGRDLMREARP